jgi:hypothetical protein
MVELLFVQAWKGDNNDAWNAVAQAERHKTALSDYLLTRFTEWGSSFAGLTADFEVFYERFELLGALAYLEAEQEDQLQTVLNNPASNGRARMPMGRVGWHSSSMERLTAELRTEEFRKKLCDAGFAQGKPTFLDLFLTNAARIASHMSW